MFTQPVVYKPKNEKEADELIKKLKDLGYIENYIHGFRVGISLGTGYDFKNSCIGFFTVGTKERIEVDNPDLFLAIAAMTDEQYGIAGEWWIAIDAWDSLFKIGKLYKSLCPISCKNCFIDEYGNRNNRGDNLRFFRKATVEELTNYFMNNNKEMKETQTLTRGELIKLFNEFNCQKWKEPLIDLLASSCIENDSFEVNISNDLIEKLYKEGTSAQIEKAESFGIKRIEKSNYQILSFINKHHKEIANIQKDGKYTLCDGINIYQYGGTSLKSMLAMVGIDYEIYQVKRLSDSEIFTVGDKVKVEDIKNKEILSFRILANDFIQVELCNLSRFNLKVIEKVAKLFTTYDDIDIYEENLPKKDTLVWVCNGSKRYWVRRYFSHYDGNDLYPYKVFSDGATSKTATNIMSYENISLTKQIESVNYRTKL